MRAHPNEETIHHLTALRAHMRRGELSNNGQVRDGGCRDGIALVSGKEKQERGDGAE